jgi:hypothetical protein
MSRPFVFALLGAIVAGVGTFLPAVHVDVLGVVRYWDAARGEAIVLLLAAGLALLAAWRQERIGLFMGALAMWGALLWPWLSDFFATEERSGLAEAAKQVGDAATALARDVAWNFTDLSWGLFVLAAGCLLMSFGAVARSGAGGGRGGGKGGKGRKPAAGDGE